MTTTPSELAAKWRREADSFVSMGDTDAGLAIAGTLNICADELALVLAACGEAVAYVGNHPDGGASLRWPRNGRPLTIMIESDTPPKWGDAPLYAAPQPASVTDGWRVIESAPKDGTRMLLWGEWWSDDQGEMREPLYGGWSKYRERWEVLGASGPFSIRPSVWQPLPPPPGARGAGG